MARKNGKDRGVLEWPPKSGNWYARLYVNGKEHRFKCSSKTEAKAVYVSRKADLLHGRYIEKPKASPFHSIAADYVKRVDARRRRKGDDKSRVDRWIKELGDRDINKITPRHIERVLASMLDEGYAPGTVLRSFTVLRALLNDAKRLGLLLENPASRVKPPTVNNVLIRYLTEEQEVTLIESLPEKYRSIVMVALNTGCRQGELLKLRWQDIDWHIGVATIHETKAGDSRRVPLNSTVQNVLVTLKEQVFPTPTDRVFPLDGRYLRRAFERAVLNSGLAPFRFHDLRHTFASRLAMKGANDRTLMALGGWKSPRMLSRYAHLSPTHLWQAVEGLVNSKQKNSDGTVTKTVRSEGDEPGEKPKSLKNWSGKGDLNPRPSPWQGDALPLSYSRSRKSV